MKIFGYEFKKSEEEIVSKPEDLQTFTPPQETDGAIVVAAGGMYGHYVDLQGSAKTEAELVTKYRTMALTSFIDMAVMEIVNEAIVQDPGEPIVKINLSKVTTISANVKRIVEEEFDVVLELLNFNTEGHEVFRNWYVDGRLYYHAVIDVKQPDLGIQEMRYVDPRKIRKVKEVQKKRVANTAATSTQLVNEYFVYNDSGFNQKVPSTGVVAGEQQGLRIAKDAIVHVTSGVMDETGTIVYSHLHKAIKPLNQLSTLEDATVIYRLSRAPERRIFYIDVGSLPKQKAEQYLYDMMQRHKNRVVYDSSNGEVRDERKFMTMLEDYWLPRREGNRGTQIETLPGGQNLGEMGDVEYFQKKLYNSLNIPVQRLQEDSMFSLGKPAETTREELKFAKFVKRLKMRFNKLFVETLGRQLVLKRVMTAEEWESINTAVDFEYAKDNYYSELKDLEIINNRINAANSAENFAGKYYSHKWIRSKILRQTEEEMLEEDEQMDEETQDPRYQPPEQEQGPAGSAGGDGEEGAPPDQDMTQQIVDAITQYVAQNGYDRTEVSQFVRDKFGVGYTDAYYYVDVYKNGQQ